MVVSGKLFDRISNCLDFISSLVAVRESKSFPKDFLNLVSLSLNMINFAEMV